MIEAGKTLQKDAIIQYLDGGLNVSIRPSPSIFCLQLLQLQLVTEVVTEVHNLMASFEQPGINDCSAAAADGIMRVDEANNIPVHM